MMEYNVVATPIETTLKLGECNYQEKVDTTTYKQMVKSSRYLCYIKPNSSICYSLCVISKIMHELKNHL